ncbi:RNA polymerase II mediator complex subunit [Lithohypha guttulata]|uniref:Mediator of RNA polymerase II transcription subunit 12 n=1 Tax=Lithohypha guttulata TaxID=1690604 RepID=A0AAN7T1L5_9EURO|nr:RNA polymerase II mediator complex subunit [Lithohypha guttulata]
MTSNLPAQPRPPPSTNIVTGWGRQRSYNALPTTSSSPRVSGPFFPTQDGPQEVHMTSELDIRPVKRRKVDSTDTSPKSAITNLDGSDEPQQIDQRKYVGASWVTALAAHDGVQASVGAYSEKTTPLPRMPWSASSASNLPPARVRTSCRYRVDAKVSNTPDSLQCPSNAPTLEPKKPADYYVWAGNHPEDATNENNVKAGYWDRAPQPPERESNTAKPALYNAFKHRQGLQSLSALFSLVLDQKSKHGALDSSTTFRPPPRVTLTEAKRRSWIADLADGGVPLRRLSRTIPQGIKGLPLLEQCLINAVPANRALWFAKCVGANEIRILKRKGITANVAASAESKWLKEWTSSVEQFLEAAVNHCGREKWSANLRYSLQLCTRLYQENLLEKDHFLDWIVKSFATCKLELLAAWLPLVQLYRQDLVRFRKRARSTAGALLSRLTELSDLGATHNVLWERLQNTVRGLLILQPACFLMPDQWRGYAAPLQACLNPADEKEQRIYDHIASRNRRLLGTDSKEEASPRVDKAVFEVLDSAVAPFDLDFLSQSLDNITTNRAELTGFCLQWATSRFRGEKARVFLIARLLRRWHRMGSHIDTVMLAFFTCERDLSLLDPDSYRHLFAELSRSKTFSNSRFLQSLSIKGSSASRSTTESSQDCSFLLRDLCLADSDDHMLHLRSHLLKRQQDSSFQDNGEIELIKYALKQVLHEDTSDEGAYKKTEVPLETLQRLDWADRFNLSAFLRAETASLSKLAAVEVAGRPPLPGSRQLTLRQFLVVRDTLEAMDDIALLADVLHLLSNTKQECILAAMADTVHCHAASLSAIGALEPLQKSLGRAYIVLRTVRPCILHLATALVDLCRDFPCPITPLRALHQDLIRGDRGRALAACSPFSDGVAESLQQAGATFVDDFEAILQGEPNMNEQAMTSLLTLLVSRITKDGGDTQRQGQPQLYQLLARLRLFRTAQADMLIRKWLIQLFSATWSEVQFNVVIELLYNRCATIETLLEVVLQSPQVSMSQDGIRDLIVASCSGRLNTDTERSYVVKVAAQRFFASSPLHALELLLGVPLSVPGIFRDLISILFRGLSQDPNLNGLTSSASKNLITVVDELLGHPHQGALDLDQMLSRIGFLSLPFVQFRVSTLSGKTPSSTDEAELAHKSLQMFRGLHLSVNEDTMAPEIVQAMLDVMPAGVSDRVRNMVEQQFFDTLPRLFHGKTSSQPLHATSEEKQRSFSAVQKIVSLGPARTGQGSMDENGTMIEKLTVVAKMLGSRNEATAAASNSTSANASSLLSPAYQALQIALPGPHGDNRYRDNIVHVLEYLNMFLIVVGLRASFFSHKNGLTTPKAHQHEQIKLIALLASIATQPSLTQLLQSGLEEAVTVKVRAIIEFSLDVAARLADDLSDEARHICTRILKDRLRDERTMWLVGSMTTYNNVNNPAGHGLSIMHETKGFVSEFRPRPWEMLESGGGKENDTCLGLGFFGAKRMGSI